MSMHTLGTVACSRIGNRHANIKCVYTRYIFVLYNSLSNILTLSNLFLTTKNKSFVPIKLQKVLIKTFSTQYDNCYTTIACIVDKELSNQDCLTLVTQAEQLLHFRGGVFRSFHPGALLQSAAEFLINV